MLGTDNDRETTTARTGAQAWKADTPPSPQVIKSGSLAITKTSIGWVKNIGGITGLLTAVAGVVSPFIEQVGEPVTVTLIASAALILSSVAIALSLLVKGDLDARGTATAARH
ncbi:hypothetical protein [Cryobacterium sp. Hz9]|uniref:hypothetical protein n=1 Tax=Cryobacterium sp. Hz9 TaxID=1259167 RepID=UPI00106B0B92|nr:hypothetical protein [Cryobacterium sp. Hz9]TFB71500.1 hypothetical protein E3N85_00575 [Cryobacterium sp. Hz9]